MQSVNFLPSRPLGISPEDCREGGRERCPVFLPSYQMPEGAVPLSFIIKVSFPTHTSAAFLQKYLDKLFPSLASVSPTQKMEMS